jgi:hypothetical protein
MFENQKGAKVILTRRQTEFEVNLDTLPSVQTDAVMVFKSAGGKNPEEDVNLDNTDSESLGDY